MDNGLNDRDRGVDVEFLVQVRQPQGSTTPNVDIHHPFLWYWDAFPIGSGWSYVNRAGREQELVRWDLTEGDWFVEVRALEFRSFLSHYGRSALMQLDFILKIEADPFDRVDDNLANEWSHFSYFATYEAHMGSRPAFSGVMGQYIIRGVRTVRVPRWAERDQDHEYPEFIYDVDAATGTHLKHSCNPQTLGTYFDADDSRLHYLTPVYFKREVLQPYAAEPRRYSLSGHRLTCLGLWGIDISINSAKLVEVYLGDLGEKLPSDEWAHWKSYNVSPEGTMEEGRYRRDFLGQWAASDDPVRELQRARKVAVEVSESRYGSPIWRQLTGSIRVEFESLMGPLNDDPASLGAPLLTLTKAIVDAIDSKHLKTIVSHHEKGEQSLRLLSRLAAELGDEGDVVAILRKLQNFRSRGGIAHLEGSGRSVVEVELGIVGLSPAQAFEQVVREITASLTQFSALLEASAQNSDDSSTTE